MKFRRFRISICVLPIMISVLLGFACSKSGREPTQPGARPMRTNGIVIGRVSDVNAPDPESIVRGVRERYSSVGAVFAKGRLTYARLALDSEGRVTSYSDRAAYYGWVKTSQYKFDFRQSSRDNFVFNWEEMPVVADETILVPESESKDLIKFFSQYEPAPIQNAPMTPRIGQIVADSKGVQFSGSAARNIDDAFNQLNRETGAEFFTPSIFGYSKTLGNNFVERQLNGKNVQLIGQTSLDGADCWVVQSIFTYRSAGEPVTENTSTPGLLLRSWVDKRTFEIRRLEEINNVDFGVMITVEERSEE